MFQNFNLRKNHQTTPFDNSKANQPAVDLDTSAGVLLKPKSIEIKGVKFIISQMPCTVAQEVAFKLPPGLLPLVGNFTQAEDMYVKMLSYCERVYDDGRHIKLINKDLIDNHVPDFDTLLQLEREVIEYNYGFFDTEKLLNLLNRCLSHVESRVSKILTDLLGKLSQQNTQL